MATDVTAADVMTDGVIGIDDDASVADAAAKMRDEHIRSLVVVDDGEAVGILVGRDIVYQVVSHGRDPADITVGDVMTDNLITAAEHDDVEDLARAMIRYNISRVPILRGETVVGIVTQSNIMNAWPAYVDLLQEESELQSGELALEPSPASGTCDACENYSDELIPVDGELLCATCRDERM